MKKGDRFYTIAYTQNARVIEVEVIDIDDIDGEYFVGFQRVDKVSDKWYLKANVINEWKFPTRELAEAKLKSI